MTSLLATSRDLKVQHKNYIGNLLKREIFHNKIEPQADATGGSRTHRKREFKSRAYANSATMAQQGDRWGLNPQPPGPQPGTLPVELRPPGS